MKSKNIVFVLNEYDGHGGAQRVASILAKTFKKDQHRVEIISINEQGGGVNYFDKNIPVYVLHRDGYRMTKPQSISATIKKRKWKLLNEEVRRRIRKKKSTEEINQYFEKFGDEEVFLIVIQVWGMQWLEDVLYKPNIRLIGTSHESYAASKPTHRYEKINKYYRMAEKFVLLTEKDSDSFRNEGFLNTVNILNPSPYRKEREIDAENQYDKKSFSMMGRLIKEKGFQEGIEAFRLFNQSIPGWKLNIYGDGEYRNVLQKMVKEYNLEDVVNFHGETQNPKAALEENSIFLLPSHAEGLPMSIIEAQSMGLPCIATDCAPGIRTLIDEYEDGYIVPVKSHERLYVMMKKLANQQVYQKLSLNSFEKSKQYSPEKIKEEWYKLFYEIGGK